LNQKLHALAAIALLAMASPGLAGPYTDDLSRCLVDKSSAEDKNLLVRWIFVAMAQHPSVSSMTRITPAEVDNNNKAAAGLFVKLLTETCLEESRKAIKLEGGTVALQQAFQVLGQVAGRDLMSAPEVSNMMAGLSKHVDEKKIEALGQ
jgi:hypothetical protein